MWEFSPELHRYVGCPAQSDRDVFGVRFIVTEPCVMFSPERQSCGRC